MTELTHAEQVCSESREDTRRLLGARCSRSHASGESQTCLQATGVPHPAELFSTMRPRFRVYCVSLNAGHLARIKRCRSSAPPGVHPELLRHHASLGRPHRRVGSYFVALAVLIPCRPQAVFIVQGMALEIRLDGSSQLALNNQHHSIAVCSHFSGKLLCRFTFFTNWTFLLLGIWAALGVWLSAWTVQVSTPLIGH